MAVGVTPFRQLAIDAQSADETQGIPKDCTGYPYLSAYVSGVGTTSSGVITFEEADYDPSRGVAYGGTWSPITTVNASDVTGGAQKTIKFPVAAYAFVRVRISTAIGGGGTISVVMRGSGS